MRKFQIPNRASKKAYPRAFHNGTEVRVRGVDRLDEAQRVYYSVQPVTSRSQRNITAVRCDKLQLVG